MSEANLYGGFFRGKTALITGSSRGIGRATAHALGRAGARVVVNGRNRETVAKTVAEIEAMGGDALAAVGDVTDPGQSRRIVEEAVGAFGRLDILVNNAGISMRGRFERVKPEVIREVVELNVLGSAYAARFAIPYLRETKGGLVFVSSLAGLIRGLPNISVYAFSKMSLTGLAESLMVELAGTGVYVGIIYPGLTEYDPEKRALDADGNLIALSRESHSSMDHVARAILRMIRRRRAKTVLTAAGKLGSVGQWLSPGLVRFALAVSQRTNPLYK